MFQSFSELVYDPGVYLKIEKLFGEFPSSMGHSVTKWCSRSVLVSKLVSVSRGPISTFAKSSEGHVQRVGPRAR